MFLSRKERMYVVGDRAEISDAHQAKLRTSIRNKLRLLKVDLQEIAKVDEFRPEYQEFVASMIAEDVSVELGELDG